MIRNTLFFGLLLLLSACDTTKKTTNPASLQGDKTPITQTTKCKIPGVVKDYTGTDGCKFLIEMANGEKWLPNKINDASFKLKDGQQIIFGYKEITDAITVCMAESKVVEITCIKEVTEKVSKPTSNKECANASNPITVKWMTEIIRAENPNRITKYTYLDGWAYMIFTESKRSLYNCQGKKLCPDASGDTRTCLTQYLSSLSDPIQIYVEGPDE